MSTHFFEGVLSTIILSAISFLVVLAGYIILCSILASGAVKYCFIKQDDRNVFLMGHIDWRADRNLGKFDNLEDAVKAAALLECPLDTKRVNETNR